MLASDRAVVFACDEGDFARLYYHTVDVESLTKLLIDFQHKKPLLIGYVDRVKGEALCAAFREAGFVEMAHYLRMTNAAFPEPKPGHQPEFANTQEVREILSLLLGAFNAKTDYLPSHEKLKQLIEQQQVIVRREANQITGLVVFQVIGRQANFNYLLNRGRPGDGKVLMQSFIQCMADRGLDSGFLWVESTNERARKVYQASGWKPDGLHDWFFFRTTN